MKRAKNRSHGSALIVVLACLVMITGLVIAFLVSMQSRLVVSRLDYASGEAGLLTDAALNVVIGQIQNATQSASANHHAWASQPGMVRTYQANGELVKAYKLYSAETMVTDAVDPAAELAALADWDKQPAIFTDLNAPRDGIYPIVDPSAATSADPVAGFTLATPPGSSTNTAPMPGRWLYLLQDGTLAAPTLDTDGVTANIPGASATNKIVGRVAFWTDDETSRVNINTAAGDDNATDPGSFWDLPLFDGTAERNLSLRQPINAEYQRYPGHPATVSLSTVFPDLTRDQIYALSPRVADGGTKGGTVGTTDATAPRNTLDEDRLYASVDELVFQPSRTENAPLTKAELRQKRFFLTATSRAPELTLFGTPRISLWPVHADLASDPETPFASVFDGLTAFCSTFGTDTAPDGTPRAPFRYYFQRKNADSPTEDYLDIDRNQQLYSYLQDLTARPFPGFTGSFLGKYPQPAGAVASDRDQILTQMFDYVRSTNLFDTSLGGDTTVGVMAQNGRWPTYPVKDPSLKLYQYTDPTRPGSPNHVSKYAWPGHGQVAPISIGDTRGFGRSFGVAEVAVHIICTADGNGIDRNANGSAYDHRTVSNLELGLTGANLKLKNDAGIPVGANDTTGSTFTANSTLPAKLNPNEKRLQAVMLVKVFSPSHGFPALYSDLLLHASGLENLNIGGVNPFPVDSAGYFRVMGRILGGPSTGGGTWTLLWNLDSVSSGNVGDDSSDKYYSRWSPGSPPQPFIYQWVSDPFTVTDSTMSFGNPNADITIKIFTGNGDRAEGKASVPPNSVAENGLPAGITAESLIQTLKVRFPTATIPTPDLLKWGTPLKAGSPASAATEARVWWGYGHRFRYFAPNAATTAGLKWSADSPAPAGNAQGTGAFIRIDPDIPGPWKLKDSDIGVWPAVDYSNVNSFNSDVVRSMIPKDGDARLILGRKVVEPDAWQTHPDYANPGVKLAHTLSSSSLSLAADYGTPGNFKDSKLVQAADHWTRHQFPNVPPGVTSAGATGDWDNGLGSHRDGPFINMPDEGMFRNSSNSDTYYSQGSDESPVNSSEMSPNRIIHSAGQFGSLPTGVHSNTPYQTLLFRPQSNHPQSVQSRPDQPPDHLFMDLFTMPSVEPYAISEPFSTAGRVNLNYQILPYTYIHRSTALQAAMQAERIAAVPTSAGPEYKRNLNQEFRFKLNLDRATGTLRQFEEKFAAGDIFRSATEICDIYLTPEGEAWSTNAAAEAFWNAHKLTGDNARERPYAKLYAKLTTRSNSYQVYYRVQALQQTPNTPPGQWIESRGRITSEQRGSAIIERYLDPNDNTLQDHAANASAASLDGLYKYRILAKEAFD